MEDFTRGKVPAKHLASINTMVDSLIGELTNIKDQSTNVITSIEQDRRVLAAAIETAIAIIVKLKIKLPKQLNQYERSEVPGILNDIASKLPQDNTENISMKETLEDCARKVETRNKVIAKKVEKLNVLESSLSSYYLKEKDFDDEVVINLAEIKAKKAAGNQQQLEPVQQVVNEPIQIQTQPVQLQQESKYDKYKKDLEELFRTSSSDEEIDEDITINNNYSLKELAELHYDNPEYWNYIYNYKDNKDIIDGIRYLNHMTLEEFIETPDMLFGFTLKFPSEIKTYTFIPKEEGRSRAA